LALILNSSIYSKLDKDCFERLFKELYTPLCRYCLQFLRRTDLAEEIVQEQFIVLWEKRNEINITTSYKAYLYKSVKNRSLDYLKSKFAKLTFESEEESIHIPFDTNPFEQAHQKELEKMIEKAIESLPQKCYAIFSMSRFGELSNKEIANQLNISEKTVENQITIAIKKVKEFLDKSMISILVILGSMFKF
jgi:RNA polymerase sigma-70 factor (ECF subfamily)